MSAKTSSLPVNPRPATGAIGSPTSKSQAGTLSSADIILFYDGTCGFCSGIVRFILKHEGVRQSLKFATLQGQTAATLRLRHPHLSGVDSVVWYQPATGGRSERVLLRSDAGLAAVAYLGGLWCILAVAAGWIPRRIRDAVYDAVARNRHRLAGKDACLVPTEAQRARFID